MNIILEPIKIIYKYNNNNNKNQYLVYIFVGVNGLKYKKIFDKIEKLDIYNTLMILSINDIDKLIEGFGEKWILCFFNKYHISYFVNSIEENNKLKKELLNKYDEKFINSIINEFKNKIINKKQYYSYGEHILNAYKAKMGKKIDKLIIETK